MSEADSSSAKICDAIKRTGEKCTNTALPKLDQCEFHHERHRTRAKANGRKGGIKSGVMRASAGRRHDLSTLSGKIAAVQHAYDKLRSGEMTAHQVTAALKCVEAAVGLREHEDREAEIQELRQHVEQVTGVDLPRRFGEAMDVAPPEVPQLTDGQHDDGADE